jgi:hypothetical protein
MLDEMRVLRAAARNYRAAATAAGQRWPEHSDTRGGPPPDLVYRLFDVDHVADQLTWLESQGWDSGPLFPHGGVLLPWPTDATAGASLNDLSGAVGTPFPWRRQMPLFRFSVVVFTFVLEGDHEGEIWRYEIGPDYWDTVRAAPSLAALLTQWTKGLEAGVVFHRQRDDWLVVGDRTGVPPAFKVLRERAPHLDPMAFPVTLTLEPLLRRRQRECGVDLDCIERGFDCQEELLAEVDAVRASLGV